MSNKEDVEETRCDGRTGVEWEEKHLGWRGVAAERCGRKAARGTLVNQNVCIVGAGGDESSIS